MINNERIEYDGVPPFVEDSMDYDSVDSENNHYWECEDEDCDGCLGIVNNPSTSKIDRALKNLQKKLKGYSRNLDHLEITETSNAVPYQYHFNIAILSHFTGLVHLYMEFTNNPLEELNSCFEKLEKLETLELRYVGIITWDGPQDVIDLHLPQSLVELRINTGQSYDHAPHMEESDWDDEMWMDGDIHFTIVPQALPNLKSLTYIHMTSNIAKTIQEFIQLNPQLELVRSNRTSFNARTIQIIEHIPGLEYEVVEKDY